MSSLLAHFGYCTKNKANCDVVINGTYIPLDNVEPFAKFFIETLTMSDSIRDEGAIDQTVTQTTS